MRLSTIRSHHVHMNNVAGSESLNSKLVRVCVHANLLRLEFRILRFEFKMLNFRLWTLNFDFWLLNFELWFLDFEIHV